MSVSDRALASSNKSSRLQVTSENRITNYTTPNQLSIKQDHKKPDLPFPMILCVVFVSCKSKTPKHHFQDPRKTTHHDRRQMTIQHPLILIVLPMNLQKVRTEVLHSRVIVVRSIPEGRDTGGQTQVSSRSSLGSVLCLAHYFPIRSPEANLDCRISVLSVTRRSTLSVRKQKNGGE